MIRDRIVVGLADQKLSEKLQLDADLTLEKALNTVRRSESVRSQQSIVRGQEDANQSAKVDRVHKSKPQKSLRTSLNPQGKTYKQSVGQLTKEPSVLPKMLIAENVKRKVTSKPSA